MASNRNRNRGQQAQQQKQNQQQAQQQEQEQQQGQPARRGKLVQLTGNAKGRQIGETFRHEDAESLGILEKCKPFEG